MASSSKEPSRLVNVLVAQDIMPDTFLPDQIARLVKVRKNIKARTLTWHPGLIGGNWELHDSHGRRKKHMPSDELVEWADLLVVVCMGAGHLSKMLQGGTDVFLLELLRSWDVSKKILLVPGMSCAMWENPMTKKQLNKIRKKWNWIHVFEPVLWHSRTEQKDVGRNWVGLEELVEGVKNRADLISIGHDLELLPINQTAIHARPDQMRLPLEIWSLIFEYVGDWEIAKALNIYTNLPKPTEWKAHSANAPGSARDVQRTSDLEWAILIGTYSQVVQWFTLHPPSPRWLSKLSVKLIIKFARTDVLSYLESYHMDLFWSTFGHTLLPTKASAVFGKVAILDWWKTSPSFLTKEYNVEALDAASKAGFIHILEWWRASGLPLRYTEAALEQASSRGSLEVLEWWRNASLLRSDPNGMEVEQPSPTTPNGGEPESNVTTRSSGTVDHLVHPVPLRLKVGKSIIYAAQNGQAAALEWWVSSGIPTAHEETVARIASANGHVNVLQLWKHCKGEKMQYDNQVLVGPTKNGHVDVLEWWKESAYTVEYKTCDIEEALEDSLGGSGEDRIRAWWARNGLNLGVGTSEWMKVKVL